jgi:hypothetical protein
MSVDQPVERLRYARGRMRPASSSSVRNAYEKAPLPTAARENVEGMKPSNPQAYFGAEIEKKREELVATRE